MRFNSVTSQERWKDYPEQDLSALNMSDQQGLGERKQR